MGESHHGNPCVAKAAHLNTFVFVCSLLISIAVARLETPLLKCPGSGAHPGLGGYWRGSAWGRRGAARGGLRTGADAANATGH